MKLFILKIYKYDCSSKDLIDVEVKVCSSKEICELKYKNFIYEIYKDNDGEINLDEFDINKIFYEDYDYEIIEGELD